MHRAILMVLYGTGMRRAEAAVLKVADIDSERMLVHIRDGKGRRDRDVPLSRNLLEALRGYWLLKSPRSICFTAVQDTGARMLRSRTRWSGMPFMGPPSVRV